MEKAGIFALSPPWILYHKKVQALFKDDPQVNVRDLGSTGDGNYVFLILVSDKKKADAIKAILRDKIEMGNITVTITILGPDEDGIAGSADKDDVSTYNAAFSGNPIFSRTVSMAVYGSAVKYCIFKCDVIQFWCDDISDYYGNCNCLAEDIAREVLKETSVWFCTEQK